MTPAERKRKERKRDKKNGLIRHEVKAHSDDWPKISLYALELKMARASKLTSDGDMNND
tara:strand:+ start:651 stop:827 length:177 start_codon:yes stop_codon:yes gene_type:complete